jgi:predicted GNAT family N-acyltransferase
MGLPALKTPVLTASRLDAGQQQELEDFLVAVFIEDPKGTEDETQLRQAAKEDIADMFAGSHSKHIFFVLQEDDLVVASGAISPQSFNVDIWGISWISVDPHYRSQGVGQKIVETCLAQIAQRIERTSSVILATSKDQELFYSRAGFSGTTLDHNDRLVMTRTVQPIV